MKNAKVTITSALLAIAAFSSMADAKCAFTKPLGGDSYAAGDTLPIQWIDDGSEPKCSDMTLGIELRVGSENTQEVANTVTSGVPGSAGSASYVIPQVLQKTDSTYFLEMHKKDAPADFQNFSGRFAISGVKAASGDSGSTDNGSNSTDTNTGDSSNSDSNSTTSDHNSTDTGDSTDNSDDSQDNGKSSKGSGTNKNTSPDGNTSTDQNSSNDGASDSTSPNKNSDGNTPQPNAASSSWSASFTSLAIVAVGAVLSNLF